MNAEAAPQLQKGTSEQGAGSTAGGAYASRDDPRAQAAQPTQGKSDKQIVQVGQVGLEGSLLDSRFDSGDRQASH